jgi:hypothetical protein
MNIKPTFVTLQQAKLLNDNKFNIDCRNHWEEGKRSTTPDIWEINGYGEAATNSYPAPEQWQVVEYLRINHNIWIVVNLDSVHNEGIMYFANVIKFGKHHKCKHKTIFYKTPQEAYSAAFDYVLNNMIKPEPILYDLNDISDILSDYAAHYNIMNNVRDLKNHLTWINNNIKDELYTKDEVNTILANYTTQHNIIHTKEHLCWANADFNGKCFICGKENSRDNIS